MNPARKTIEVTLDDIWFGEPKSAANCPIARSLKRQFPKACVSVFYDYAHIGSHYARMPKAASKFVLSYDTSMLRRFKRPFTFSLEFIEQRVPVDFIEDNYYNSVMEEQAR